MPSAMRTNYFITMCRDVSFRPLKFVAIDSSHVRRDRSEIVPRYKYYGNGTAAGSLNSNVDSNTFRAILKIKIKFVRIEFREKEGNLIEFS